jgi:hypothetical protein
MSFSTYHVRAIDDAQRRDWEDLGKLDPYWANLTDPAGRWGRSERREFLRSGEQAIDALLQDGARFALPLARRDALDICIQCVLVHLTRSRVLDLIRRCGGRILDVREHLAVGGPPPATTS